MKKKKKFHVDVNVEVHYAQPIANPIIDTNSNKTLSPPQEEQALILPKVNTWRNDWKKYKIKCWQITKQQALNTLENYNKRVQSEHIVKYGFGKCMQSEELYVLDHRISIWYGYKNDILPEIIGNINNLKYIPSKHNSIKGTRCVFPEE
jgi:hypothetical protein